MTGKQEQDKKLGRAAVFVKIFFLIIFIVGFALLVYKNTYPSGELTLVYRLGQDKPHSVSQLEPKYRVSEVLMLGDRPGQILISNPVYFNLRTVLPFERAKVSLLYKNPGNHKFKVGGLVNKELWQFDLKEIDGQETDDGWLFGQAEFSMLGYLREENQYRFILSVPYTELENQEDGLVISEIKLELYRQPLTFKTFWQKLFNKIKAQISQYENTYKTI